MPPRTPAKKGAKKASKKATKKAATKVRSRSGGDSLARKIEDLERLVKKLVEETFPNGTPVG
jgi:hypothetical protein